MEVERDLLTLLAINPQAYRYETGLLATWLAGPIDAYETEKDWQQGRQAFFRAHYPGWTSDDLRLLLKYLRQEEGIIRDLTERVGVRAALARVLTLEEGQNLRGKAA